MKREQKNTLLFALGLLALLLLGLFAQRLLQRDGALRAVVELGGRSVAILPLNENQELTVEGENGGYNHIRVADGAVFIEDADCPDRICVKTGRVDQPGGVIACLPHGLIVYVESGGD